MGTIFRLFVGGIIAVVGIGVFNNSVGPEITPVWACIITTVLAVVLAAAGPTTPESQPVDIDSSDYYVNTNG